MNVFLRKRFLTLFALALVAAVSTACGDNPVEEDDDPADSIVTATFIVGNQTIVYSKVTGGITGGPIVIGTAGATVSATFKDAAGATVTGLDAFEVRMTPANTALVAYTSTGKFTGTLTKLAAGSTELSVQLYHIQEAHADLGPFNIPITIQ